MLTKIKSFIVKTVKAEISSQLKPLDEIGELLERNHQNDIRQSETAKKILEFQKESTKKFRLLKEELEKRIKTLEERVDKIDIALQKIDNSFKKLDGVILEQKEDTPAITVKPIFYRTNKTTLDTIIGFESFSPTFYEDAGSYAIGYGSSIDTYTKFHRNFVKHIKVADVDVKNTKITEKESRELLMFYLRPIAKSLEEVSNDDVFDNLCSFAYNCGIGVLGMVGKVRFLNNWAPTSKFNDDVIRKEYNLEPKIMQKSYSLKTLAHNNSLWIPMLRKMSWYRNSEGKLNKGLIERRDKEIGAILKSIKK